MLEELLSYLNLVIGLVLLISLIWFSAAHKKRDDKLDRINEEEPPIRYRIPRTPSFEEKLNRARMEASHPIPVPIDRKTSTTTCSISPEDVARRSRCVVDKQFSSSLDTDDGSYPADLNFDSGNASASDSEHNRKQFSESSGGGGGSTDECTSSEDEKIAAPTTGEMVIEEVNLELEQEFSFPGSNSQIVKVTGIKKSKTSPMTIQVETRAPSDGSPMTVFELLSNNREKKSVASVPRSSRLISTLIRKSATTDSRVPVYDTSDEDTDDDDDVRSDKLDPDDIHDVDILDEMLLEETEYDVRRKIRRRIRELKENRYDETESVTIKYAHVNYIVDPDSEQCNRNSGINLDLKKIECLADDNRHHDDDDEDRGCKTRIELSNGVAATRPMDRGREVRMVKKKPTIMEDEEEYVNLDEITDENELLELLDETDDIDERKKIRARLLELKAAKRNVRESKLNKIENDREAALKKKVRDAEEQKQRTMAMYDEAAKSAPAGAQKSFNVDTYSNQAGSQRSTPSRYIGEVKKNTVEDSIKARAHEAENRKKRILAAYDHASKTGQAGCHRDVDFEAFKRADVSEFMPQSAASPGSATFGMSSGVSDIKGPFKASAVAQQISASSVPEPLDAAERAIRARVKESEDHKKKLLAAYDMAAKEGSGGPKTVVLSNYLNEIEVPAGSKLGVTHSSTAQISEKQLPTSPRDRFRQMDSNVATKTAGNNANTKPNFSVGNKRVGISGIKDMILNWCQSKTKEYENIKITNFSSSWANGLAFCALTHHFYPDAFDYHSLQPENRRENFDLAFQMAEDFGGVCPLLETDDMIMMKDKPDWKCVFTYVQSLYQKYRNLE